MIPEELIALPQWVVWHYEVHRDKRTKVPYSPATGEKASSTDPSTWATYEQAAKFAVRPPASARPAAKYGLGFVFSPADPYVGVDMDQCLTASGALRPGVNEIVKRLGGYVEFSPSWVGLHIIVRGSIERGRHTLKTPWANELAIYDHGRFFTISGHGRGEIRDGQDGIAWLLDTYFPAPDVKAPVRPQEPLCATDTEVVDRLLKNPRCAALWAGDTSGYDGDHSAADLALCADLAYFTGGDAGWVDALFRRSGLMRDKWDQPRGTGTYGSVTIARALG